MNDGEGHDDLKVSQQRSRLSVRSLRCQEIKNGHAQSNAVCYLAEDNGALVVDDVVGQFHPPVHRAGMHDEKIWMAAQVVRHYAGPDRKSVV